MCKVIVPFYNNRLLWDNSEGLQRDFFLGGLIGFSVMTLIVGAVLFEHIVRLMFDAVDYLDQIRRMLIEIKNKDIKQI